MTTYNKFDKGILDHLREHNAISIRGEAETRAAMADMKQRLEYDQRMEAWGRQKRLTMIPLAILAVALLSVLPIIEHPWGSAGSFIGEDEVRVWLILFSLPMVYAFLVAWKFIYIMFSMSTGVPPSFWNLAAFSAMPVEDLEPAEKFLVDMDGRLGKKVALIRQSAKWLIFGFIFWLSMFMGSFGLVLIGMILVAFAAAGVAHGFRSATLDTIRSWGGPFFFPEINGKRLDREIEAAWRKNPSNPTVSRRSMAGKTVIAARAWRTLTQNAKGGTGGTQVRTA